MKKLFFILILCFLIFPLFISASPLPDDEQQKQDESTKRNREIRSIASIDSSNIFEVTCINGHVIVHMTRGRVPIQLFGKSKTGQSVPLTCKKYIENKKKIIKAKSLLIDL